VYRGLGRICAHVLAFGRGQKQPLDRVFKDSTIFFFGELERLLPKFAAGDVADDANDATLDQRDESRFVMLLRAVRQSRIFDNRNLVRDAHCFERGHNGCGVAGNGDVVDLLADDRTRRQSGQLGLAALEIHDGPVRIEPEKGIWKSLKHGAHFGITLRQFLRTQFQRAFEQYAIVVELLVSLIDAVDERLQPCRKVRDILEDAEQLPLDESVHHGSEKVVMVMVWLCNSHRPDCWNGAISPYE